WLPADAPVRTCYEAGRDGFWVHRALAAGGVDNLVVDSTSIEVDRRRERGEADPVDAAKLPPPPCRVRAGGGKGWGRGPGAGGGRRGPAAAPPGADGPAAAADGVRQPHPGAFGLLWADGRGQRPVPGDPVRAAGLGGRAGAGRARAATAPGVRRVGGRA